MVRKKRNLREIPKHATVVERSNHNISRKNISPNAIKVLYRLHNEGYAAFLVGGSVRDLLLGREPKDFDVATDAHPNIIKTMFRNAHLIGRRFRLVHITFRDEIIEVSTFRAHKESKKHHLVEHDNIFGTFAEDAERRDFTVNALYYNIADFSVVDCHQGMHDLTNGIIRIIGDPEERYREDPVRLIRAIRFAAKLGFRIEEASENPIHRLGHLLTQVPPARLFTEFLKLFLSGACLETYTMLRHHHLFKYLMPVTETALTQANFERIDLFITEMLKDTDERINSGKTVTPAYLLAALLWHPLLDRTQINLQTIHSYYLAMQQGVIDIIEEQNQVVAIPRIFTTGMRDIWLLQARMEKRQRNKINKVLSNKRFRAGFDFLKLRARCDDSLTELANWWDEYYHGDIDKRKTMLNELRKFQKKKKQEKK